ncbi:SANT/Myb domain [Macleaya cordata]|uniref:SANT/Myb domain n=1 Tax=Macleaya cordata TaxID=56857 RepID=A0A200QXS7_MACCD|nr:SANT/Myb domain [Macleaya cordata]
MLTHVQTITLPNFETLFTRPFFSLFLPLLHFFSRSSLQTSNPHTNAFDLHLFLSGTGVFSKERLKIGFEFHFLPLSRLQHRKIIDINVAGWILEFLLSQPIEDRIMETLLNILPLSNDDSRLIKRVLLRRILSDISNGSVSEKTLETLEMIEEYDYEHGIAIFDSMREAYHAVAVHCTVMCLKEKPDDIRNYFDAVMRIWRGRISDMERWERVGLVSERLKDTRDEIEEALWNVNVRNDVLTRDTWNDALKSLRVFLTDVAEEIGPSFLEIAAKTMCGKGKVHSSPKKLLVDQVEEREACSSDVPREDFNVNIGDHLGHEGSDMAIDFCMEMPHTANCKPSTIATPEVRKVQEALKSSTLDLQAVVEGPLPDTLLLAANISASMAIEETKNSLVNQNVVDKGICVPSVEESVKAVNEDETNTRNQSGVSRPSLMVRNSTARTYEWDEDSIESSYEGSPNRPHLPTPKKRVVSPLAKQEIRKNTRRKIKKWSPLEEQTLRDAVKECGRGNWKLILDRYHETFEERTVVDLKDKWRNMTR